MGGDGFFYRETIFSGLKMRKYIEVGNRLLLAILWSYPCSVHWFGLYFKTALPFRINDEKKLGMYLIQLIETQFYESRIVCLFTFWIFSTDKSFKLISKCTQKCQHKTRSTKKKKTLCNTWNWGNWNSGFVKLGFRWAERDNK